MSTRRLIRHTLTGLALAGLLAGLDTATAQVRFDMGIALPGVRIGVNVPAYPQLVPVPGYPVYYAPDLDMNLFFYDGLYWVYTGDQWYASSWYDGPWELIAPAMVPAFILRIPIVYYRRPPAFFLGWNRYAAPRWGEHWGTDWQRRRPEWDRWDHRNIPQRAPLPRYQRHYPRERYPDRSRQRALENRYYGYRPRDFRDRRVRQAPGRAVPRANRPPMAQRPRGQYPPGNHDSARQRERSAAPQGQARRGHSPRARGNARDERARGDEPAH